MYILLIKEIREEKGITQQELANRLNIARSYLSEIENNIELVQKIYLIGMLDSKIARN